MMNLVVFGAPGCGKGTQSERLIDRYGFYHISTGDLLRKHIADGTELGKIADTYISKGHLIPDELMLRILADLLDSDEVQGKSIIFDGFPRTVRQAEELEGILEKRGRRVDAVIGLEVGDDILIERLVNRGISSGRSDDNIDTIRERLNVYHDQTLPLRDFYVKTGKYHAIDGSQTVDAITDAIAAELAAL